MDELLDMIATDKSAADISDSIKDTLYAKAAERITSQRPDIASQLFDPSIADTEVSDEPVEDSTEEEA
jgi:hypothetical protein|tara:strand:- start:294 stop:497 length:204 start_codon:yes stop_codon:yes gene_type:complete